MAEIIKSTNTKGNQYHLGAGVSEGGQFTSPNENTSRREHIENPIYEKLDYLLTKYEGDDYEILVKEAEKEFYAHALSMIMEDTGYDEKEAKKFQNALNDYCGDDYKAFSQGYKNEEVKIIDAGIKRMPKFDGRIMRGTHFECYDQESSRTFLDLIESLEEGAEISIRNTPTSWTSNEDIAFDVFGKEGSDDFNTIIYACDNNKSGASVRHLSLCSDEDEIIVPSNAKYRVKKVISRRKASSLPVYYAVHHSRTVVVLLEEI